MQKSKSITFLMDFFHSMGEIFINLLPKFIPKIYSFTSIVFYIRKDNHCQEALKHEQIIFIRPLILIDNGMWVHPNLG